MSNFKQTLIKAVQTSVLTIIANGWMAVTKAVTDIWTAFTDANINSVTNIVADDQ